MFLALVKMSELFRSSPGFCEVLWTSVVPRELSRSVLNFCEFPRMSAKFAEPLRSSLNHCRLRCFLNFFEDNWIRSSLNFYKILWASAKFHERPQSTSASFLKLLKNFLNLKNAKLPDLLRSSWSLCKIPQISTKFCGLLQVILRFCEVIRTAAKFSELLRDALNIYGVLWISS